MRYLPVVFVACAAGAALVVALEPWRGDRKHEKDRGVAETPGARPKAWDPGSPAFGRALAQDRKAADDIEALSLVLDRTPSSLTLEQESANLKDEELILAREVAADFPDTAGYNVLMGDLHARHGDSAKAMEFWERCLEIEPRRADVYARMGHMALEKEEQENAIACWRKALEIRPDMAALRFAIAKALIQIGSCKEVIAELEKEPEVVLRSPDARLMLGEAYLHLKEYQKAKQHFEAALELNPDFTRAHHGLMTVHNRQKQYDKAREHLVRFEQLKVKDHRENSGDRLDVRSDIERLREGLVTAYLQAEELYGGKGDVGEAERLLLKALRIQPQNTRSLERLAVLYLETNRLRQSLEVSKRLGRIDPEVPRYHLNIGLALSRLGDTEGAEEAFRRTLELSPEVWIAHRELARLYLQANRNLPAAGMHAQRALGLAKTAENYFVYAWASDVNGNAAEAIIAIEQAIRMEPANPKYRRAHLLVKSKADSARSGAAAD